MGFFSKKNKEPFTVEVKGRQLTCTVCNNDHFYRKTFQLKTTMLAFFDHEKYITGFTCSDCTHIHLFNN